MDLISPVLSVSAFAVIVASGSSGSTFVAAGRIVSTCGLFAYSVYYAHPLLLTFVRWAMADAGGIASESVAGTVLAFPLTVLLTTVAVKGLARCPGTQYLV
jgi:peptidoglycan/LPS O-acetylase OafA/YrhL